MIIGPDDGDTRGGPTGIHATLAEPSSFVTLPRSSPADLVLTGGKVITVDAAFRIANAVAVANGRIVAVGTDQDVSSLVGPETRRIQLDGKTVVPGLIDGHAHMDREGLKRVFPSLEGARSIDDVLHRIAALASASTPGEWIVTMPIGDPPYYLDAPHNLRERRFPTRWELDEASPHNPVYIKAIWGYWRHTLPLVSVANSEALRRANITRDTAPPSERVQIDKDPASGEPTGIFLEWTYMPIVELSLMGIVPGFTAEHRVQGLLESMHVYHSVGTTGVFEGHGIAAEVLRAYKTLWERGDLTVRSRLVMSPSWGSAGETTIGEMLRSWGTWLAGRGVGDPFLRVSGVFAEEETSIDNAIRARARPYTGWAGFSYDSALPRPRLKELLLEAARSDIRVAGHTPSLLDLYEEVDRVVPIAGKRWVIGHISTLRPDEIRRIRDLGIVLTTHTNRYIFKEGEVLARQTGVLGEDTVVPLRSLKEAGVHFALATDNVPPSLFHPLWHCVARVDRTSNRIIAPSQRISRQDALRAATIEGAYLTFEEAVRGSIEVGKLADLAVLSADPLTIDEPRMKDIVAEMTIVGGRIVYRWAPARGPDDP